MVMAMHHNIEIVGTQSSQQLPSYSFKHSLQFMCYGLKLPNL